jgi:large subunit ribosomal protein L6
MSRVGKQIINIPAGVDVKLNDGEIIVKGKLGELKREIKDDVIISIADGKLTSEPRRNDKSSKALWGTYMSLIKTMISGVETEVVKKLIVEGVGFKWDVKGDILNLSLGFSHPVTMKIPTGLKVEAVKGELTIKGIDKELVTLFAMQVKKLKKPEPYKGKGIRYEGEVIRRKEGKKSA